jgi:hypothetical protein
MGMRVADIVLTAKIVHTATIAMLAIGVLSAMIARCVLIALIARIVSSVNTVLIARI